MLGYLQWQQKALEEITRAEIEAEAPKQKIGEEEQVIDVVTDLEVKKIYVLASKEIKNSNHILERFRAEDCDKKDHDATTCSCCISFRHAMMSREKSRPLISLFWVCLKDTLSPKDLTTLYNDEYNGLGIRKDWKVVIFKKKQEESRIIIGFMEI